MQRLVISTRERTLMRTNQVYTQLKQIFSMLLKGSRITCTIKPTLLLYQPVSHPHSSCCNIVHDCEEPFERKRENSTTQHQIHLPDHSLAWDAACKRGNMDEIVLLFNLTRLATDPVLLKAFSMVKHKDACIYPNLRTGSCVVILWITLALRISVRLSASIWHRRVKRPL